MTSEFCPRCGNQRVGAFQFCRTCAYDFDQGAASAETAPVATPTAAQPVMPVQPEPKKDGVSRKKIAVGAVAVVVALAAIGSLGDREGEPAASAVPTGTAAAVASPTVVPTVVPTVAPTARATPSPEPAPTSSIDPEFAYEFWVETFESTSFEYFETEVADAIESDYYWIDSIDRTTFNASTNLITYEATVNYEGVYERDLQEWQDDTWELVRDFGREIWASYRDGVSDGLTADLATVMDWPRWTPGFRLDGNSGRLRVTCPGAFINAIADRDATQGDYADECAFRN